jgi:hypothetical protein
MMEDVTPTTLETLEKSINNLTAGLKWAHAGWDLSRIYINELEQEIIDLKTKLYHKEKQC